MARAIQLRSRREDTKPTRRVFLIVCEGEKTEPNYFEAFRLPKRVADIRGIGANTSSLVREAKRLAELAAYDEVWCVFDRDSFPKRTVNQAIAAAEAEGFKVAFSNEAFELWYLLHFAYMDNALSRHQYFERLQQYIDGGYKKNRPEIYELLLPNQRTAIKNAKRLENEIQNGSWADRIPYTGVYRLVEVLNKASKKWK